MRSSSASRGGRRLSRYSAWVRWRILSRPAFMSLRSFASLRMTRLRASLRLHRLPQLLGLEMRDQRLDDHVEVSVHDVGQVVHGQADAVVGDAVLREVVRADLLRTVAAAD